MNKELLCAGLATGLGLYALQKYFFPAKKQVVTKGGDEWFLEANDQWPGFATSLKIKKWLFDEQSKYQHVQVFESESFGNVLVLDDVIQLTERDEMAYQEMIAHLPLFAHPNPKSVLIIGGGDGAVLREVMKHTSVERVVMIEIDQMVIDASIQFFNITECWKDPRFELVCNDAFVELAKEKYRDCFDVIICDSSDPDGPAEALFELPFYKMLHTALAPGGIASTQAESMWMHINIIKKLVSSCSSIFEEVKYATTQIPTYPCGQIGLLQCKKAGGATSASPSVVHPSLPERAEKMQFKYYSPALHTASFTLPAFLQNAIY